MARKPASQTAAAPAPAFLTFSLSVALLMGILVTWHETVAAQAMILITRVIGLF